MKKVLRHFLIETLSLYFISNVIEGISFERGVITLIIAGVILTLISFIGKPIINMLLLPLNLITFGLFKWISSSIVLFLTTLIVTDFNINYFLYQGFNNKWLDIPVINLHGVSAYTAISLIFSLVTSFVYWLIK